MHVTLFAIVLAGAAAGQTPAEKTPRRPSPIAPSLPELTREEEDHLDQVIDRFIRYDIGQLHAAEGAAALSDFKKLGPEAIPALIRGLNRAAMMEHSCPATTIALKLKKLLLSSSDMELLQFARENIGADGADRSYHARLLQELRFQVLMRRNAMARRPTPAPALATGPAPAPPTRMTAAELAEAAGREHGSRLRPILGELARRNGSDAAAGLATVAGSKSDRAMQQLARDLLDRNLARQGEDYVRARLKDEFSEVRQAAARVVGSRMPKLGGEVIELLDDDVPAVREAAHQALVKLSKREDFGPAAGADKEECARARQRWRDWWDRHGR
jgi:hypothetical protein